MTDDIGGCYHSRGAGDALAAWMILPLTLVRDGPTSLQQQVFAQIRERILSGELRPGAVLPPSRLLAEQNGVSRNTVVHAYDWLISEGYLAARRGAGTFVATDLPENCLAIGPGAGIGSASGRGHVQKAPVIFRGRRPALPEAGAQRPRINFWPGRSNRRHFPLKRWRKLAADHLSNATATLSEYGDPAGVPELRSAIADHLAAARGLRVAPEQVLITAGIQEGLNIVARLFVSVGTNVFVENPCYQGAALVFESYGATLIPLDVDRDGVRIDQLHGARSPLAYLTPSHQFPTGTTLSLERRLKLLEWAQSTGGYLLEDDYDSDFRYSDSPLVALAGLDGTGSVIYLGTLSKSIDAGLRTGFMVMPERLLEPARAVKALLNFGHPWLEQAMVADFIASGGFRRHLRRIRHVYQEMRDCLLDALERHFGRVDVWGSDGGMHVMWRLPQGFPTPARLMEATRRHGTQIHTLASGGACDYSSPYGHDGILLGYSSLSENEIRAGIEAVAKARDELASSRERRVG